MRPAAAQWREIGYDGDPVPGDPDVVAAGGADYLAVAEAIVGAKRKLDGIELDGQISQAVDKLLEKTGEVASNIGKAEARYRAAGQALTAYAPVLRNAQDDSAAALYRASSARQASDSANSNQQYYLHLAQNETDPASALQYTNLAKRAGDDADDANATLSGARSQIDEAVATRDAAAERAISQIHEITSHDGLKDSWWDNWGKDLLEKITDIAGIVASIAGVLALCVAWIPVVGQVLAAALLVVTAVAAVVNAIGNTVLAATGDRSWTTAIVSIIGAALACIGIGGALRVLATAGKEGVAVTETATTVAENANKYEQAAAKINQISRDAPKSPGTNVLDVTPEQLAAMKPSEFDEVMRLYAQDVPELNEGDILYRLYSSQPGGSTISGASFTRDAPFMLENPRAAFGLPPGNSADRMVVVRVDDPSKMVLSRHALPLEGGPGGSSEYIFPGQYENGGGKGLSILYDKSFELP
ncbi:hypothetical protein GCM10022288_21390 [Gryllotalpicola kribbensis]|uniref:Uncharacterized protein n=1 Tax=Gryllotalpicola kribbensis TaxID=993084 RepID=A0ABP8AVF0_9MICO